MNTFNENMSEEITLKNVILSLKKWIVFLRSKMLIVAIISILAGSIGFLYAHFVNKIKYEAELTFALEDGQSNSNPLSGALGLASSFGIDIGGASSGLFGGSNIIELIKTRRIVERTLLTLSSTYPNEVLANQYLILTGLKNNFSDEQWQNIKFSIKQSRETLNFKQDSVLGELHSLILKNNLVVSQPDKKVSFIKIQFRFEDEVFSKEFVKAIIKEVSEFYVFTKSQKAKKNVDILIRQADSVRNELNQAITGVAVANDETYNLNPALNVKRISSSKKQIDVQANTAILTELVKNLEIAKMTLMRETPLIQVVDEPVLPLKKEGKKRIKAFTLWFFFGGLLSSSWIILKKIFNDLMNNN